MTEITTIPSRIATLSEGDSTTISGVAISAGDITRGLEGVRKVWTADELRAAASSLEGQAINPIHSEQEVGVITRSGWDPTSEAVVWQADITDSKLADQVDAGQLEVSIEARHTDGGTHDETGAMLASDIQFTGMALVQHGSAPSATAEAGPSQSAALSARLSAAQIDAALSDETAAEATTLAPGTVVSWDSQGDRPAAGTVLETIDEGRYDTELAGDAVVNAPAALIRLHRPESDGWERTDTAVAHKIDTLSTHASWPEHAAAASDYAFEDVPDDYVFENPGQATGAAEDLGLDDIHEHETDDGTVFMPGESMGELFDALEAASELAEVKGVEYTGTASGELDESEIPNDDYASHYAFDGETKSDSSYPLVDADGDARAGNVESAYQLYGQAPDPGLLLDVLAELNDAFDDPPIDPESLAESREESAEAAAPGDASPDVDATSGATPAAGDVTASDDAVTPERGQAEAADPDPDTASETAASTESTTTDTTTDMTDDPTNDNQADEPSVDELKSELADVREKKSALAEDHEDLESERDELKAELESKSEQVETAKREYAAALVDAGETLMDEDDLVERFELAELAEKYDESEEAALADTTDEDPEPDIQSGGGGSETATLSDAERSEKRDLESKLADLEGRDSDLAEAERERIEDEIAELEA